jgi:hypothetical protein
MFGLIVDALRHTVVDLGKAGIEALVDGAKAARTQRINRARVALGGHVHGTRGG